MSVLVFQVRKCGMGRGYFFGVLAVGSGRRRVIPSLSGL